MPIGMHEQDLGRQANLPAMLLAGHPMANFMGKAVVNYDDHSIYTTTNCQATLKGQLLYEIGLCIWLVSLYG